MKIRKFNEELESFVPESDWYYELRQYNKKDIKNGEFIILDPFDEEFDEEDLSFISDNYGDSKNLNFFKSLRDFKALKDKKHTFVIVKVTVEVVE